jgi:hypothetical protein
MPPETWEQDGIWWIELKQAAKYSRTKATLIEQSIERGAIPVLEQDGKQMIPMTAANRLKRETSFERSVRRKTRVGDTLPPGGGRAGPLSTHREKQDVLPMSSGRKGRGWIG